jgi:hypothetical protein
MSFLRSGEDLSIRERNAEVGTTSVSVVLSSANRSAGRSHRGDLVLTSLRVEDPSSSYAPAELASVSPTKAILHDPKPPVQQEIAGIVNCV